LKLALIVAVFLISSVYTQTLVTAEESEYDVIVIGAGIAGLATASELNEDYNVLVLEARDRIGGRVLTDKSYDGYFLDLGASWIHGVENNPIAMLAEKYGAKTIPFDDEDSLVIYDENGEQIDEQRDTLMWENYDKFVEFYQMERENILATGEDTSLQDVVGKFIQNENLTDKTLDDFYFLLVWNIEGEYGADASDISLGSFEDMGYKMEGHEVIFPQGYGQIIDGLSNGLDIRLEHLVMELDYSGDTIKVKTNKGDFDAKYVISTLPLGVLKNSEVVFSPELPQEKTNALNNLNMGLLNKVYFVFPDVFWDEEQWIGHIPSQKGHWVYFANLYSVLDKPVLLAFNSANFGNEIEAKSDADIVNEGLTVLKTIYGDAVSEPSYTKVTKWTSDEFSFGSYSYTAVGSTNDDFYELSKSLDNKVFFAGEATEVNYPATVHGAYFSGMREANKIQWLEGNVFSPKTQLDNWVLPTYVICKDGLELLITHGGESAACVTGKTKDALEKRGWGYENAYSQ